MLLMPTASRNSSFPFTGLNLRIKKKILLQLKPKAKEKIQ